MIRSLRRIEPPPWRDPPVDRNGQLYVRSYEIGDCWYASPGRGGAAGGEWFMFADGPDELSRHRLKIASRHLAAGVVPVVVVLPDGPGGQHGYPWCVHAPLLREGGWVEPGWTVEGSIEGPQPTLTVHPSIDVRGGWHGLVRNGRLEGP